MNWKSSLVILAFIVISCSNSATGPESRAFNLKFSYGVGSKNVLNTFQNTYTKDLILDGTITVPFTLSDSELQCISAKMDDIGFFSYPEEFAISPRAGEYQTMTPFSSYYFDVHRNSTVKRLHWVDSIIQEDSSAAKLRELIFLIENIVHTKPEYWQLPQTRGAYM